MATVNFGKREILCKIVYYGPGLCGKTTNLQTIHAKVPSNIRGNLTTVATKQDRTLFFDMMPIDIGTVRGFKVRLQLYTVPGQVFYNASRKIVLKGVDGIVFVADSQVGKMEENVESLQNLADNLIENKVSPNSVPIVLQFNKRDLSPIHSIEELNSALNPNNLSFYESIATAGHGVFNTLKGIAALVVNDVKAKLEEADRKPKPHTPKPDKPTAAPKQEPYDTAQPAQPSESAEPTKPLQQPVEPIHTDIPEEMSEPDHSTGKRGFWEKVSNLWKKSGRE